MQPQTSVLRRQLWSWSWSCLNAHICVAALLSALNRQQIFSIFIIKKAFPASGLSMTMKCCLWKSQDISNLRNTETRLCGTKMQFKSLALYSPVFDKNINRHITVWMLKNLCYSQYSWLHNSPKTYVYCDHNFSSKQHWLVWISWGKIVSSVDFWSLFLS